MTCGEGAKIWACSMSNPSDVMKPVTFQTRFGGTAHCRGVLTLKHLTHLLAMLLSKQSSQWTAPSRFTKLFVPMVRPQEAHLKQASWYCSPPYSMRLVPESKRSSQHSRTLGQWFLSSISFFDVIDPPSPTAWTNYFTSWGHFQFRAVCLRRVYNA